MFITALIWKSQRRIRYIPEKTLTLDAVFTQHRFMTKLQNGVRNSNFNTIELYFDHLIDKEEAIRRLRFEKPNLQLCFRTQKALESYLHFEGSEQI